MDGIISYKLKIIKIKLKTSDLSGDILSKVNSIIDPDSDWENFEKCLIFYFGSPPQIFSLSQTIKIVYVTLLNGKWDVLEENKKCSKICLEVLHIPCALCQLRSK